MSPDLPAEQLVYDTLVQIRQQAETLLKVTDKLADNGLVKSLLADPATADPCGLDIAEISPVIRRMVNAVLQSQDELVEITKVAQALQTEEGEKTEAAKAIKSSVEVLKLAQPLGPRFRGLFPTKPGCEASSGLKTASKDLAKISTVVKAVSTTELFGNDKAETKENFEKIASVTKTISRTTGMY